MKRHLLETKLRLTSASKRLEDLRAVFPDADAAFSNVLEADIRPALATVDYLISLQS